MPDALDLNAPARLEVKALAQRAFHFPRYMDLPRQAVALQPRGQVDRLSSDIIGKPVGADYPRHHRSAGHADPYLQIHIPFARYPFHNAGQLKRQPR